MARVLGHTVKPCGWFPNAEQKRDASAAFNLPCGACPAFATDAEKAGPAGAGGERLTYDPGRLHGVNVYREANRGFSAGDRVQFTAPYRHERIANRQLGTVERIDSKGNLQIRLDSGRDVRFSIGEHPHLDYRLCRHQPQ